MRLKSIVSLLVVSACSYQASAQQIFRLSQYTQHNFVYNPAASGAAENASIGVTYKKMWSGIAGGPKTILFYGDKYFEKMKTGISVVGYDDKTGPTQRTGGMINLSYSVKLNEKDQRLMLGVGGSFLQYKIDKAELMKNPELAQDPLVMNAAGTVTKGDASAGIYFNSPTLNLGVSAQQLIQTKLNYAKGAADSDGKLYTHYNFMGSYNWKTDDENVVVPNFLVKYQPNAPVDVEVGVRLEHADVFWVGANYHHQQYYSIFAGVKIDHKLAIGYAYDQYKTPLSIFDDGGGAHEISLRYFFMKKK